MGWNKLLPGAPCHRPGDDAASPSPRNIIEALLGVGLPQARGVEFTEEPEERPYGIDCGFRDPSGNSFRRTQVSLPEG